MAFPVSPTNGQTHVLASGKTFTYNSATNKWFLTSSGSSSASDTGTVSVYTSDTAPTTPDSGDLWFDTETLRLYVYYVDADSNQWVLTTPVGLQGNSGTQASVSGVAPSNPSHGDFWFNSDTEKTYVYVTDEWILAGGGSSVSVISGTENFPANADSSTGDMVYEVDSNKLFIFNGTGWDTLQATQNQAPTWSPSTTNFNLSNDGTPTVVNLTATDPEGIPLTYNYSIDSGNSAIATIALSGNTLTVTPTTDENISGNFNLSVSAYDNSGNSVTQPFNFALTWSASYAVVYQENTSGTNGNAYLLGTSFGAGVDNSGYEFSEGTYRYFVLGEGGNGGWSHYQGGGSGYATIGQFTATTVWRLHVKLPEFRTTANEDINTNTNLDGVASNHATQFKAISTIDSTVFGEASAQPGYPGGRDDNPTDADGTSGGGGGGNSGDGGAGGSGGADGQTGTTYGGGNGIGVSAFETRRSWLEAMLQSQDPGATVTAGAGGDASVNTSHGGGGGGGGFLVAGSSILPNKNGEPGATISAKTPGGGGQGWGGGGGGVGYDGSRGVGGFGTGGLVVITKV